MQQRPQKCLDPVRDAIRVTHDSIRTAEADINGIRRYLLFHNKHHPQEMGIPEVEAFLTHFAVNENMAMTSARFRSCSVIKM
ncbi:phage integrase N-terminal SAM-like domain-containing protein [Candidatus Poribacteria bacterium]|nr:phage integrase N-terminal SAM-like domain-containing protein [Candidatus Poribacteria bacterium]